MHILVTNDDGVQAPGLLALTQAMRQVADKVTVLALTTTGPPPGMSRPYTGLCGS